MLTTAIPIRAAARTAMIVAVAVMAAGFTAGSATVAAVAQDQQPETAAVLGGRVIAVGIPGAGAITAVGRFLPGGPIHDKPEFAAFTTPGRILDPERILVASGSNFGAPIADASQAPGAILSIVPTSAEPLIVPAEFAISGDQASTLDGRVQLLAAQSPAFLNGVNNPGAVTAAMPSVSNPRGLSLNNGFGRIWPANAPTGMTGPGTTTILDPSGIPLAGAPSKVGGGVFGGAETNRRPEQVRDGALTSGAVGVALLGKSPDDSGRAVFAVVAADGSIVQVQTELGLDGLAPAGTITPLRDRPRLTRDAGINSEPRAGVVLNFEPVRILYIADPGADTIVALTLLDDGRIFLPGPIRRIESALFDMPVDLAPAKPETDDTDWASNTTLEADSDLYVVNRGNNTIVRLRQDGAVVAVRRVVLADGTPLGDARLNGIAVSPDGARVWVTVSGALPGFAGHDGAVLELLAFGGR